MIEVARQKPFSAYSGTLRRKVALKDDGYPIVRANWKLQGRVRVERKLNYLARKVLSIPFSWADQVSRAYLVLEQRVFW